MKKCSRCREIKSENLFSYQNKEKGIRVSACKKCLQESQKKNRVENIEEVREQDKKQYQKHKEKRVKAAREYRKKYPDRTRETNLKCRYGLTVEKYNEMLKEQNSRCAICGKPREKHSRNFAVDHNHTTGKVRALLCDGCNYGVGFLENHREKYEEYLERYDSK